MCFCCVSDAAKNWWSGLVGYYYHGRWSIQAKAVRAAVLANSTHIDIDTELGMFEEAWSRGSGLPFAALPSGDTLALAHALLHKLASNSTADEYVVYTNTDAIPSPTAGSPPVDMVRSWNTDAAVLRYFCSLDLSCAGFNTGGWLKNDTSHTQASKGNHDLWVKKPRR